MDLDPRYLQAFLEVGRARSFSRAAAVLHKTQPAISYQIRQLEQQLGASLFDRTSRRLTFTAAGGRLFELCDAFFGQFGRLAAGLRDPSSVPPEPLRIASVSAFGRYVLFPVLARLRVPYSLRFPTADQVFAALHDGTCDVGFVYLPHVSSRIVAEPVCREELVLIASPRAEPRRMPRAADELAEIPCIAYDESEYVFGKWFEAAFGNQPRSLQATHQFEELEEVVATVAERRGWSIVPEPCAAGAAAAGRIAVLRHRRRRVRNTIYVVTRAGGSPHPAMASILEALR